ncbi:transcription antitermination protein NusB, partial [Paramuribaculum intestinale]
DPERLAFMDLVVMVTAIAELLSYPLIPIPVTLNEYIEIANSYSTSRSGQFVNGILYSVINHLREEGRLNKN